jgi:hypothetical protein
VFVTANVPAGSAVLTIWRSVALALTVKGPLTVAKLPVREAKVMT